MPARSGQMLSHYRLVERIGEGGMGVVYRARDEHLERDVAVKVLRPGAVGDESARNRFRKEALALSQLNHPNIATIYDFDTQDGVDFLAMEYVRGKTLSERLAGGSLSENETLGLGRQLAEGLIAAHAEGILHRDLKPGNLRITHDDRLKILDFGLAKMLRAPSETAPTETQTRGVVGTLAYMAPEQLRGAQVDERTDLYAAGAVLYEMASGKRPFPETDTAHLVYAVLNKSPEPLQKHDSEISQGLQNTVLQAMAKQPDERYTSAVDLRDDLERLQQGLTPTAQPPRGRRWRRLAGLAAIAVVLAVVAVAVWNWQEWVPGNASAQIASLAVLPLENLSGDPAQDYFADGMTEALITDLGKLGRLQRVIARPSVERFKGSDLSLREIAGEFNVKALVVGSATQEGERVRITAQLIRADNEEILWSDDYVRQRMDVLILQGEIARAIASEILGALTEPELSRITRTRTVDPEVHEAYLKGKFHLARFSPDGTTKALEYLQQAVAQNPDYAAAHASLGYAYFLAGQHFGLLPFKEAMAKSKTASLRAIEIDDSTAEAYSYLGYVEHFHEYNWTAAEDAYRKAVELNPSFSYGHSAYAFFLSTMGFHDAALEEARRAVELDPVSLAARVHLAEMLYSARRYDEMLEECQRIIDLDPTFTRTYGFTRRVYEQRQMYPEAIDAIEEYRMHGGLGTEHVADLRRAYERDGETGYWQYRLDSMLKRDGDTARTQFGIATIYAALGDADRAFEYLERSYENHEVDLVFINVHPMLDPLRSDQRFHALIRRMGFPEDT